MSYIILILIFIFGTMIGSFLNCLIWRLHKKETILGRSYCPHCRQKIAWYDNIPILSFMVLRGRCRHCRQSISWQYPVVELITGILFVMSFNVNFQFSAYSQYSISDVLSLIKFWFILSVMIIVFIYDLRWYLILDIVTLPACAFVFLINLALGMNWQNLLISGIIGGGFFLLQFAVSRGRWIGGGDIRLGLLMGLSLGWPGIITSLTLAYFIGAFIGLGLIAAGKKKLGSKVPMGVFLSVAAIITLFWGEGIVEWYLETFLF
ncbi:MAG: prepilin peptidase [Candidatus Falkowbacteria bacterium]